jgi:uncharacterized membrane protein YdjX (TVP38/TMEM64 family)
MNPDTVIPVHQSAAMQPLAPASDAMPAAPAGEAIDPSALPKRPVARALLLLAVLAVALAAVQLSPVRALLKDTVRVKQMLDGMGPFAYPVCLLASAVLIGSGFPRLVLCAAASMVLGFWWGVFLTQAGAVLGYYAVFCFIRWGGGDWVTHRRPRLHAIADTIQDQGVAGVVLARQIPLHGTLINLCLGLSRVKHRHFLIGTAIGLLPEAIPVALVGAGAVKSSFKESAAFLGLAALAFAALWIGSAYALRTMRSRRQQDRPAL